ncbi:OsmC family protein [Bradyrhizobium sp. Ec3.3]|uniref:OsmC family protein n=1 Tax=Bradyrhizobium sp. Ec3.3 TaxID=189753 RepID=UPI000A02E6B7|nr:OsmC family protein [Bradyrhizobium sp. Ec3.3]
MTTVIECHSPVAEQSAADSTAPTSTTVNGIDTGKLSATIEAIKADASLASFQFRLSNQWIGGGENHSRIDDFYGVGQEMRHKQPFSLVSDEPEVLLSQDRGPNAGEYVLHALASCLTGALVFHAAARGIVVKDIATRLEGDIDLQGFLGLSKDVRRGFKNIRVLFDIDADCDDSRKQELIEMAQAYSPVFDMLSNGLPVSCGLDERVKKTETA